MTNIESLTQAKHKMKKAETGKEFGQAMVDHFTRVGKITTSTAKAEAVFDGGLGLE